MKPFNLEKFLAGEPAITRDGRKVIDWHYFKDASSTSKISALVENSGSPLPYSEKGTCISYFKSDYDLFMEEKEVDLWINITKNRDNSYSSNVFRSESNA